MGADPRSGGLDIAAAPARCAGFGESEVPLGLPRRPAVLHASGSGTADRVRGMAFVPGTGQVVLSGKVDGTPDPDRTVCLVVLTAAGKPDGSFNGTGTLLAPWAGTSRTAYTPVAVQGSPAAGYKILAAGEAFVPTGAGSPSRDDLLVGRYAQSGVPDSTFRMSGGYSLSNYAGGAGYTSLAVAANGSLVVGGKTITSDPRPATSSRRWPSAA